MTLMVAFKFEDAIGQSYPQKIPISIPQRLES